MKARIITAILITLTIALSVAFWLNLNATRSHLQQQLDDQAYIAAHALGLALSNRPDGLDDAEPLIEALFSSGRYALIRIEDAEGRRLREVRHGDTTTAADHDWFQRLFPLHTEEKVQTIFQQWNPIGRVIVRSDTQPAYEQLWQETVNLFMTLLGAGLFIALFMLLYLRRLFLPLNRVVEQAHAITRKQYITQHPLPRPRELKAVVSAMNHMVEKLQRVFERGARVNEQLQKLAYLDELTGLGNRAFFDIVTASLLHTETESRPGTLALISLSRLKTLNELYGYPKGNEAMQALTRHLRNIQQKAPASLVFHIGGPEFAFIFPNQSPAQTILLLEPLQKQWRDTVERLGIDQTVGTLNIGLTEYHEGLTVSQVMKAAGEALNAARRSDTFIYLAPSSRRESSQPVEAHQATTAETPLSELDQLARTVESAIRDKRLQLLAQPCHTDGEAQPCHLELLAQLQDEDGKPIPAREFLPLLARLKLEERFDTLVLERISELTARAQPKAPLAINLTASLFQSPEAARKFISRLTILPCDRLAFEIPEHFLYVWPEQVDRLVRAIRDNGGQVGLDHFGHHLGNKHFLQNYALDYIKLARGFATPVRQQDEKTLAYLASLKDMADDLDMMLIATGIEDLATLDNFRQLDIQHYMGFEVARATPIEQWIR